MVKPPKEYESFDYWLFHPDGQEWLEQTMWRGLTVAGLAYLAVLGFLLRRMLRG